MLKIRRRVRMYYKKYDLLKKNISPNVNDTYSWYCKISSFVKPKCIFSEDCYQSIIMLLLELEMVLLQLFTLSESGWENSKSIHISFAANLFSRRLTVPEQWISSKLISCHGISSLCGSQVNKSSSLFQMYQCFIVLGKHIAWYHVLRFIIM